MEAEREFVNSIEEWRREMNLERFALLGHSMGGFLATSYAIRFPDR
jgi:pimeloyl-ACP methyl ester carboxylesterase